MSLKAVFFDMGGTIQNFWTNREIKLSSIASFRVCFSKAGMEFKLTDEELVDLISTGMKAYHKWNRESKVELKPFEVWKNFILNQNQFSDEAISMVAEELTYLYETGFYKREMRPEIPQVLEYLRSNGFKIGIISNTQSQRQVPDNLIEYGIKEFFDPIVLSSEYGLRKPDPSIFYQAARLAKVPTSSCIYVGDKINRDILGANRAGFRLSIKIDHIYDDGEPDLGATPDHEIKDMTQLIPIIEKEMEKDRIFSKIESERDIKAIFFDAGDILYYRPNKQENFKKFLHGKTYSPDAELERKSKEIRELAFQGKLDRHEYYKQTVMLYGFTDEDQVAEGVSALDLDDDTVAIFEGVPETIKSLKEKGYILGIITDTALPYTIKLKWFEKYGFGHLWDVIISSKDLGVRKPASLLYEEAISQTGLNPCEAVFVGHKAYEIEGARKIGFKTIAFNYEESAVADKYIDNFKDLIDVLSEKFNQAEPA